MRTLTTVARAASAATIAALGVLIPTGAAGAADYPSGGTPPEVAPAQTSAQRPAQTPTVVEGKTVTRSTLPFTGTDIVEITTIAGASIGVGLVMMRRSRRAADV